MRNTYYDLNDLRAADTACELRRLKIENAFLRSAACDAPPSGMDVLMSVISELRSGYSLEPILDVAGMSRSSYYYHLKKGQKPDKYARAREDIHDIFREHCGLYGYRRVTLEMRKRGYRLNHKTVYKLMREMGLKGQRHPKAYAAFRGDRGGCVPNLLGMDFRAGRPMTCFATDVTEIRTGGRSIFLSVMIDLFSGEVVSYHTSGSPGLGLVMATIEKLPPVTGGIIHSDRGWQYQSERYRNCLKERGIRQSMTEKERCYGNAPAESFFSILKAEIPVFAEGTGEESPASVIRRYIYYYNNMRIRSGLGGLAPAEYRRRSEETRKFQ